jgi:hypothetical protein
MCAFQELRDKCLDDAEIVDVRCALLCRLEQMNIRLGLVVLARTVALVICRSNSCRNSRKESQAVTDQAVLVAKGSFFMT